MRVLGSFRRAVWKHLQSGGPHGRFMALRGMLWLGRPVDMSLLRGLAVEFERMGAPGWARSCWRLLYRMTPFDPATLSGRLGALAVKGDVEQIRSLLDEVRRHAGFPPARMVWLAGCLASAGHWREAADFLDELDRGTGDWPQLVLQSPSLVSASVEQRLGDLVSHMRAFADDRTSHGSVPLRFARLCFTFGNLESAAELYRQAGGQLALSWTDEVAMFYARARAGMAFVEQDRDAVRRLRSVESTDPDALGMLACVALHAGDEALAMGALERAILLRHGDSEEIGAVLAHGRSILQTIASLRAEPTELPQELVQSKADATDGGVPKVFICGFGWSGSGAVYDDIRSVEGFCEFEGPGQDPILNEDSDSEVTFIQSTAGLGDLWRYVKSRRRLDWWRLWDLFCLHVVGLAPIGYSNYKSCAAAANHVRRYGSLYTRPFRDFFEAFAELRRTPRESGLFLLLRETTEKLCMMLVEQTGGKAVLFNNAIFGRDVEMLEIFRASHAAAVFRDPLDVYADRKDKDRNHWRSPRQLAEFYGRGLRRYLVYRHAAGSRVGARLREIPFERFVLEPGFRWRVRAWLLPGLEDNGNSHFDPRVSSRNIGLHRDTVSAGEAEQLQSAMTAYQEMQQNSMAIWGG